MSKPFVIIFTFIDILLFNINILNKYTNVKIIIIIIIKKYINKKGKIKSTLEIFSESEYSVC